MERTTLTLDDESRPHLVFLHYFGGAARTWQWVTALLADEYQCVALDLPGFGDTPPLEKVSVKTMADWVQAEIKRRVIKRCVLLGHSMGGKIATLVAARDGASRVVQLMLVAPSPPTVERMPAKEKERMLHHPDRHEAEVTVQHGTRRALSPERYALAVETQLQIDEATWRWWLLEGMNDSIASQASKILVPITLLTSDDDPVIGPEVIQKEVQGVLPSFQLINTEGVGHLLPLEASEWLAEHIRQSVLP